MSKNLILSLLASLCIPFISNAQQGDSNVKPVDQINSNSKSEEQTDFLKMRKEDFTKLSGNLVTEGFKLDYNADKTVIQGSVIQEVKNTGLMFQLNGTIGTTTNLTNLFSQKVLPTFTVGLTANYLFQGMSTWFYDDTFKTNFDILKDVTKPIDEIDTQTDKFSYKANLRERIIAGEINKQKTLYTFKRFFWMNLAGKYDNSKYLFYNSGNPFTEQLQEPLYNAFSGKVGANLYLGWNKKDIKWSVYRPNFLFINANLQYGLLNNVSQLKKITVNDVYSSTVNNDVTRETLKSYSAYNGTFKEFRALTPSFEVLISPFSSFAINIFGEKNFINGNDKANNNLSDYGSIATGVYFYGNGTSSKINIGAYYQWTKNNSTDSWVEMIGIKTTIPITPMN